MRVVFLGTPDDAVTPLHALVDAGHDVAMVVTQPDQRRSRGAGHDPSPVKRAAQELGLTVVTPQRSAEIVGDLRATGAELGVVVAFGQLLPVSVLGALPHGFVNMHFSLLPRWRGAAPVERAILAGDAETGVCLMAVEAGLDTGPVFATARVPIAPSATAGELRAELVAVGTQLLVQHLPGLLHATPVRQDDAGATYAEKLRVEEFRLDPACPAAALSRVVRAGNPRPGAWMSVHGRRVKVWRAREGDTLDLATGGIDRDARLATANGALVLDEVQPEGKRVMDGAAWRAGLHGDVRIDAIDDVNEIDEPDGSA